MEKVGNGLVKAEKCTWLSKRVNVWVRTQFCT